MKPQTTQGLRWAFLFLLIGGAICFGALRWVKSGEAGETFYGGMVKEEPASEEE